MCCVIYYIYIKCREYLKHRRKKEEEEEKSLAEIMYNARRLNEYVRNKERSYWTSYD
jgi:hypothetical protein